MAFAHSRNDQGQRHDLVAHLRGVADLAARFAAELGAAELARFVGFCHDVGKFHPSFQSYLLSCEANPSARGHGPDHKGAGATLASQHLWALALLIQGHHGGLHSPNDLHTWLGQRAADPAVAEALARARRALPDLQPAGKLTLPGHVVQDARAAELFLRLLFSALVDADYLDTEQHFRADAAAQRGADAAIATLWERFERDQKERFSGQGTDRVGQARHAIYQHCLDAAERSPWFFRLTVPTGGGKTRSAMAFALRHALRHGQQRIIVAVPFLTITQQTAEVYRRIFERSGDDRPVVLEHHSGATHGAAEDEDFHQGRVWGRLAAENWDAPIIVTTTVQLFQSLFANGPSLCRKLHRLARSVIILDEAQALPPHLLAPILDALRQLCAHYGTTVVISTATQPAFEAIQAFAEVPAAEIVPDPVRFFQVLRRVEYEWRVEHALSWTEVAEIMGDEPRALAVLNTKKDALALLDTLGDPKALHLSTLLCGAHRWHVIQGVRRRLKAGQPCRLVATQAVEAGVDLDFPLVLRALGPLDAIIQAAGRCNREGLLARGRVVVFRPADGGTPPGIYKIACGITGALLGRGTIDPDDPTVSRTYFKQIFETVSPDREGIQALREHLEYRQVARLFQMIDDDTESVAITTYGSDDERRVVRALLDQLSRGTRDARLLLRRLQPYLVSVRAREADRYRRQGLIAPVSPGLGEWIGGYDSTRGLVGDMPGLEALVV